MSGAGRQFNMGKFLSLIEKGGYILAVVAEV